LIIRINEEEKMKKRKRCSLALVIITAFVATFLFLPGLIHAGDLEPSAAPGSTMKTVDEIPPTWSQKLQCDGTACPRFTLVMGGYAVLDKETGLVWEQQSPGEGEMVWVSAVVHCYSKGAGGRMGFRLPTIEELTSLVDPQVTSGLCLPIGHPFSNVQSGFYWSSTTDVSYTPNAMGFYFNSGRPS
jgi:hypothetical protein